MPPPVGMSPQIPAAAPGGFLFAMQENEASKHRGGRQSGTSPGRSAPRLTLPSLSDRPARLPSKPPRRPPERSYHRAMSVIDMSEAASLDAEAAGAATSAEPAS